MLVADYNILAIIVMFTWKDMLVAKTSQDTEYITLSLVLKNL